MRKLVTGLVLLFLFISCDSNKVYEDFVDFDESFWHQDSVVSFNFTIQNIDQPYRLKALFRNAQTYPFHNMYYQYTLTDPSGSVLKEELKQIYLFDPKTGEPNGSGLGDVFDNSQVVLEDYSFSKPGEYKVAIKQYMRLDTLPFVLSVGWRVENAQK